MANKFFYPVTEETFREYAEKVFAPIRRGECVTTVWVTMAGRRMWNKFLIENISLFEKELPNNNKYVLVYIEPLDLTEESLSGYIRLMAKSLIESCRKYPGVARVLESCNLNIFDSDEISYSALLDALKVLLRGLVGTGHNIVFFIGEFDELVFANKIFYNNLKSLWSGLYPRLHYVFLMRERVTRAQNITQWGELNEAILQNVVYVPLRSDRDMEYLLDYYQQEYSKTFDDSTRMVLKKVSGGHPYLLKASVRYLANSNEDWNINNLEKTLLEHYELKSVAKAIYEVRSEYEREVLRKAVDGTLDFTKDGEAIAFLRKLGLLVDVGGKTTVFCKLFEEAISPLKDAHSVDTVSKDGNLTFDAQGGRILHDNRGVEDKFTRQEYLILSEFLKNTDKLFTRDEVGVVLWGKRSYEKFSDWAIDQLISKLRKKLKVLGTKTNINTVRGRGYKISN